MSFDYQVYCQREPRCVPDDWGGRLADAIHYWHVEFAELSDHARARIEEVDVDAKFVMALNCHYSVAEYADEMARIVARRSRGVVWLDHAEEFPFIDCRRMKPPSGDFSLGRIRDRWRRDVVSQIEEQRRRAEEKKRRRQELWEKAQAGELDEEEEGFDWGMDLEDEG